ncbi:hypothetical protein [Pseudonocardia sp. TRM90224]|uniref:hypothetical protein n=1 Tax=Pseudonocardia sp. TRM90224 TaxID=2812678 RepID=UPI001E4B76E2|nr:hypothetical protein [Pseudonocardia sp. TRM90224]
MRYPSRLVLTATVFAMFVAGTVTAVSLPGVEAAPPVSVPAFDSQPLPEQAAPAPIVTGPPVSGKQLAAEAIAPARKRVQALVDQAEPEADEEGDNDRTSRQLRKQIRQACEDGRLRGLICEGT